MLRRACLGLWLAMAALSGAVEAQVSKSATATGVPASASQADRARSGDEAGIRETIRAFVSAFNAGDAKAVAALHTPDAHVLDVEGVAVEGRPAIERQYTELFKAHPGASIELSVDAVRFLGPDLAVEDGTSRVSPKQGTPWINRYTVLYLRRDGRWLCAGVREYPGEEATHRDRLKALEWLLGDWVDESEDSVMHSTCAYDSAKSFLVREFTIRVRGKAVVTGTQRIGWDPQTRQLKSWEFDSEGGHGDGLWSRAGAERWVIKTRNVLPDGRVGTATHWLERKGQDAVRWKTVDRTEGEATLPDIAEYVLVRRPPQPK